MAIDNKIISEIKVLRCKGCASRWGPCGVRGYLGNLFRIHRRVIDLPPICPTRKQNPSSPGTFDSSLMATTTPREGEIIQSPESPSSSSAAMSATPPDEIDQNEITGTNLRKTVSLQDQTSRMPARKLVVVTLSLIFAIFLSSFEQVSVSTTTPGIAKDFGASAAISWVGTSFLVAKFILTFRRLY